MQLSCYREQLAQTWVAHYSVSILQAWGKNVQHTVFPKATTSKNGRNTQVGHYWAVAHISKGFFFYLAHSQVTLSQNITITVKEQKSRDLNPLFEEESTSKYVMCALISGRNPLYQQHLYTEQAAIPSLRSMWMSQNSPGNWVLRFPFPRRSNLSL